MADGSLRKSKPLRSPEARIAAEIEAAKSLRLALGDEAEDEELYHIAIDGETSLNEMIDAILANIAIDQFKHRTLTIEQEAADARSEYISLLRAEHAAEEADYRADCARDERLMGAA